MRAEALGLAAGENEAAVLQRIKELEHQGFQFEAAEGSFEMLLRRAAPGYERALHARGLHGDRGEAGRRAGAGRRRRSGCGWASEWMHTAAEGDGPVNALGPGRAEGAASRTSPTLAEVHLVDYKVRIVDEHLGTGARPRVIIESARGAERWSTVGCSENIIEASWLALCDGLELALLRIPETSGRS